MIAERDLVRAALDALGIRRLALAVHEAALPGDPRDDIGRGAPLSAGGRTFLRFAADLGFHALQLGPQGQTTEHDQSPYDATIFSRSTISIALLPLAAARLVEEETLRQAVEGRPPDSRTRAAHRYAHAVVRRVLDEAFATFEARRPGDLSERVNRFVERNRPWLERDALYAALSAEHATDDWLRWPEEDRTLWERDSGTPYTIRRVRGDGRGIPYGVPEIRRAEIARKHARLLDRYAFAQLLAHDQHAEFHAEARQLGLLLYGDLQIGLSHQDVWAWSALLLASFRMGAPPSRTNPEGQPWSYAVLDPGRYSGAVRELVQRRMGKMLGEFDGLRIDHPHGLIDPWVYRAAQLDPQLAVQHGGRLFSSPDVPELAGYAIARVDQLDRALPRYADGWVRELSGEQVARYGVLFDAIIEAAREHGRDVADVLCEVLSTQPYPVGRVLARHGLGRFRVTQKVVLDDPADVYRSENAAPHDWIMVGTHDTEPIWRVVERWVMSGTAAAHAAYLSRRLVPEEREREPWRAAVGSHPHRLAVAKLAELFVGPARNVMVFFTDLLGMHDVYNRPGTVAEENWSPRIPPDVAARYQKMRGEGRALDLPRVLAMAVRARGREFTAAHRGLLERLEERAGPDPARQ